MSGAPGFDLYNAEPGKHRDRRDVLAPNINGFLRLPKIEHVPSVPSLSIMNFTIVGLSTVAMLLQMGCPGSAREQHLLSELQQKHQQTGLAISYAELKCCDASKGENLNIVPFQREATPLKVAELKDLTVFGGDGKYLVSYSNGFSVTDLKGKSILLKPSLRPDFYPSSSSTGEWFAFAGKDLDDGFRGLIAVNLDGRTLHVLPNSEVTSVHPTFNRDGHLLVYSMNGRVSLTDTSSGKTVIITEGTDATISPDGKAIVFRSIDDRFHLLDLESKKAKPLFSGKNVVSQAIWSPDSAYIFFFRNAGGLNLVDSVDLTVYRLQDGGSTVLLREPKGTATVRLEQYQWVLFPESEANALAHLH